MATFPSEVPLPQESIKRLVELYSDAYKRILGEIDGATDFGRANRVAIAKNIEKELTRLGVDTAKWVEAEVPAAYKLGMTDAVKQLQFVGAPIKAASFSAINREAVQLLVSDMQRSFGDSLSAVNRSAKQVFNNAAREEIKARLAEGAVTGATRKEIAVKIKEVVKERGISALNDRAGRTWSLDRYADMLARTKLVEARNSGLANKMVENGYDLVEVSRTGSTHEECARWEGELLSLTGQTPGYPTVADAEADGLFHPNCQHAINAVHSELANRTIAYNNETGTYENKD
jgi:hypothetical protein